MTRLLILVVFLFVFFTCILSFGAEIENTKSPDLGRWDFKMKEVWQVSDAGDNVFTVIDSIKTAPNGNLYVMDRKTYKIHIFNNNGKFLSSFGTKGSGPGEFTTLREIFFVGNHIVVVDDLNIHYFSEKKQIRKVFPQ